MFKDGVLTISDWQKGMADSAYAGTSTIANCEVFDSPGILKMANGTTLSQSLNGTPVQYIKYKNGDAFFITSNGKAYKNGTEIQSGLGNTWDCIFYKGSATDDYLLVRHGTVISAYGPLNSINAEWFGNIVTGLDSSFYGKMIVSKNDNLLYITNGSNLQRIDTFTGGTPTIAPSATNSSAVVLPEGNFATTVSEIGPFLMVGTQYGSSWSDRSSYKVANIFPFRVGSNATTYEDPISINECAIQQMISDNNRLYVVAGTRGNVYMTDTSNYQKIKCIPWAKNRSFNQRVQFYPNAIAFNNNGNLLIGTTSLGNNTSSTNQVIHGVYEMQLTSGYPIVFKNTISTGNFGASQPLSIGSIFSGADDSVVIGWQDGNSYGVDTTGFTAYTDFKSYFESQLYSVSWRNNPTRFERLQFRLATPFTENQQMRFSWRKNVSEDYQTIGTVDDSNTSDDKCVGNIQAKIANAENVQIKIEMTQPITQLAGENIELIQVLLM